MEKYKRSIIISQIIIIVLSIIQGFHLLPDEGIDSMCAACAVWCLLLIRKDKEEKNL